MSSPHALSALGLKKELPSLNYFKHLVKFS